jgi:hypothetical protein
MTLCCVRAPFQCTSRRWSPGLVAAAARVLLTKSQMGHRLFAHAENESAAAVLVGCGLDRARCPLAYATTAFAARTLSLASDHFVALSERALLLPDVEIEVVRILCERGIDVCVSIQTADGCTPLHVAAREGRVDTLSLLLSLAQIPSAKTQPVHCHSLFASASNRLRCCWQR